MSRRATAVAVSGGMLMALAGGDASTPVRAGGVALCLLAGFAYAGYSHSRIGNQARMWHISAASVPTQARG